MVREEVFKKIESLITGFVDIKNPDECWFTIRCKGCVFPEQLDSLRKICYVSTVSYDVADLLMEISCSDL